MLRQSRALREASSRGYTAPGMLNLLRALPELISAARGYEHDEAEFLPAPKARERLAHQNLRRVLLCAERLLAGSA